MSNQNQNIWSSIKRIFFVSNDDTEELSLDDTKPPASKNKRGLLSKLARIYNYRVELEIKEWKVAVAIAESIIRPRRNLLYRIYHRAMEDDHLLSQVRTAIFNVRVGGFQIERDGEEVTELKEYFQRPWFRAFLKYAIETEMWGHSLLEFHPMMKDGEFTDIDLIPRLHVRPEYGEVVVNEHDERGLDYRNSVLNKYLIEIGDPYDLGLLKVASRAIIRKDYALTDWSRRNEKYGMPFMTVQTASRDKKELDEKQRMAENFGSNGWAILDDQDQINLVESNQAFTFQAFEKYADRVDKAISILVNGQTGTTDEKSFVGSAEVHERTLNTYTKDRLQKIEDLINYKLIPFLVRFKYPLIDAKFSFLDLKEKIEKPDTMDKGDEQKLSYQTDKKKSLAT